jgi:hypothetical protein
MKALTVPKKNRQLKWSMYEEKESTNLVQLLQQNLKENLLIWKHLSMPESHAEGL